MHPFLKICYIVSEKSHENGTKIVDLSFGGGDSNSTRVVNKLSWFEFWLDKFDSTKELNKSGCDVWAFLN